MPRSLLPDTVLPAPRHWRFDDEGAIPNSPLPVLAYTVPWPAGTDAGEAFEALFAAHGWTPLWRAGIFSYQHFHPDAHEALGVLRGSATVLIGGERGATMTLTTGDVLILPAGTGHRCLDSHEGFAVVGAYPQGQETFSTLKAGEGDASRLRACIAQVPLPVADPVTGVTGPLMTAWRA
ncbi:cupin domain-containing protein [Pseudomonas entomophila]|uniref:cupin domain-containing protein n=1 Tax=Pseudomonas entomophila TaxID=312306 RepID=UPI003EBF8BAB